MSLKYPIGEQYFKGIREEGKVYVDKTETIYKLVNGTKYNFLSRPRRFGKSLLLSTLETFFKGEKEVFKGLKIYDLEKDWKKYPVLHLSFALFDSKNRESLNSILENQLRKWEKKYNITNSDLHFAQRFQNVIENAFDSEGEKVVILIDEYDNALINTLDNKEIHDVNKEILKSVYSNIKEMDRCIRFVMITGVSRFGKAGIFSGLNNLTDITFSTDYSAICGFTEEEIYHYLWEGVENLGKERDIDAGEALQLLKSEYDGYHFSKNIIDIYNPYSLLKALDSKEIQNYWIDSGTPSFLIQKLKETQEPFSELFRSEANVSTLTTVDPVFSSPVALLYQAGYLTIKKYIPEDNAFSLGIPNKEVREGFFSVVLSEFK